MRRIICIAAAMILGGGCATRAAEGHGTAWVPSCNTLGCTEQMSMDDLPAGAELTFTQCRDRGRHTFRYEKVDGEWKMASLRQITDNNCN